MMRIYLALTISLSILFMTACGPEKARKPKGQLELNSNPPGANILIDSKHAFKNLTPRTLDLPPGMHLVKISKENYHPLWRYVKIKNGEKISLELKMTPVKGSVMITSKPVGGKVIMDGKVQGLTPLVITDLKPGEYSAQIEHINRAPRVVKWTVYGIRPKRISVLLESNIGELILNTKPSHAKVYINGKICGFTPYKTELQEGSHELELKLNGFAESKTKVDIIRDRTTTKTVSLIRLPGSFEFRSNPEGAFVYIDGKVYGKTPLTVPELSAGKYSIRMEKNGFDSITREASINAGRVSIVECNLLRNTGGIDLVVNPPGVSIYINGKEYGKTIEGESKELSKVIKIRKLAAGQYIFMLAHKRMMPPTKKYRITVKKGKVTRPKPINVWVANAVLKIKDEPQIIVLLHEDNKKYVIYSPEPGVKIKKNRAEIDFVRPLTDSDK